MHTRPPWTPYLCGVLTLHILALAYSLWTSTDEVKSTKHKPVVVKTITLSPPQSTTQEKRSIASKPKAKLVTHKKTSNKKKSDKRKVAKKKAPQPKKEEDGKKQAAIAEALHQLSKLHQTSEPIHPAPALPTVAKIDHLAIDTPSAAQASTEKRYIATLIRRLRQQVSLPENANVELDLILDRTGKLIEITVTKTTSVVNKHYVEETLTKGHFPPLGMAFPGEAQHCFTLVLDAPK